MEDRNPKLYESLQLCYFTKKFFFIMEALVKWEPSHNFLSIDKI